MSIPHFEDLTVSEVLSSLSLEWEITEKIDGSYFEFGLDGTGSFFTKRKGGVSCYQLSDWPNEGWTQTYRLAHTAAENVVDALEAENLIEPGETFGAEILYGSRPNTIVYAPKNEKSGTLIITSIPCSKKPKESDLRILFNSFSMAFGQEQLKSHDGKSFKKHTRVYIWDTLLLESWSTQFIQFRLEAITNRFSLILSDWLSLPSNIPNFTIRECLEVKLGSKSTKCGDQNWTELKSKLKAERERLNVIFKCYLGIFKDDIYREFITDTLSMIRIGSYKEGIVVKTSSGVLFKVTNRSEFTAANEFAHIVKYWLVGGRRPNRPSFMSRTKDWSVDRRLARLDQLLARYMKYRVFLNRQYGIGPDHYPKMEVSYTDDLHTRTLLLFADTRRRIINGR